MEFLLGQLVNGLAVGSIYALVALGYTMVYGIMRLINFAHGELFMLGAYLGFTLLLSSLLGGGGAPLWLVVIILCVFAAGAVAVSGLLVERFAYRPLRQANRLTGVVSALGVSIFLQNAVMLVWGARYRAYPDWVAPSGGWQIAGVPVTTMQLLIVCISLVLMGALYYLVQRTLLGAAIRATAIDHDASRLMGINVDRVIRLVFIIGPALGAIAGIMIGLYYRQLHFTMGFDYGMKAFTAAIFGGIGNIPGAMVGGLLLGILETLGAGYVSAAWTDALVYVFLILMLIFRPTGLLGERVAEKV